jgi:hypothetical protein
MRKLHSREWQGFLENALAVLVAQQPIAYNLLTPARIPSNGGVYLVTEIVNDEEVALYVDNSVAIVPAISVMLCHRFR